MMLKQLKQAYPLNDSWKSILIMSLLFGLFVFLFLYAFEPFGLSKYQSPTKSFELLGYGLVTSFALLIVHLFVKVFFPKWFDPYQWTVGRNLFFTLLILFFIGGLNLLYSNWLGFLSISIKGIFFYQGVTISVGIFPIVILTFLKHNRLLKKAVNEAESLNSGIKPASENAELIHIPSQNKSENLSLPADQLLAIKSSENYIEVFRIEGNEHKKELLRNTLKETEKALKEHSFLVRCHRSYLVNLNQVESFSGNAQGLSLELSKQKVINVPVSRKYVDELKKQLEQR